MDPFKRLVVDAHYNMIASGSVMVSWALKREFKAAGPYEFTLLRGRAVNDDKWEPIASCVDGWCLYDNRPLLHSQFDGTFYKVLLKDGEGGLWESQVTSMTSYWNHHDWTIAREVIRKETLLLMKRAGTKGVLLKKREWGDACTECLNETGEPSKPNCETCYGTGIIGGYYPAIDYWVIMNPTRRLTRLAGDQGLMTANQETIRSLAYPLINPNDIWVQAHTGIRYRVLEDIAAIVRHRGIDLVVNAQFDQLPQTSNAYNIPV